MRRERGIKKPICANIDLYTGFIYSILGVPETLYTPLFAVARMAGWAAHRMEELYGAHRIIRPAVQRRDGRRDLRAHRRPIGHVGHLGTCSI